MRKTCLFLVLGAGIALHAADTAQTANVVGVLRVDSANKQTIVSVPWAAAADGSAISVADIVQTANLNEGDRLYIYENNAYKAWILDANKTWQSANNVSSDGLPSTAGAASATLARGGALLLVRDDPGSYFNLQGQYTSVSAPTVTIAAGTSDAPVYTLLAPPVASNEDYNLNSATWSNVNENDRIMLQRANGKVLWLKYDDGKWKGKMLVSGSVTWSENAAAVPVGFGVWYVNKGSNAATVAW